MQVNYDQIKQAALSALESSLKHPFSGEPDIERLPDALADAIAEAIEAYDAMKDTN